MMQIFHRVTANRQEGFSILEVLVAISILALVTSLTLGSILARGDRARALTFKAAIESRFVEASLLAQQTGQVVSLRFNLKAFRIEGTALRALAVPQDVRLQMSSAKEFNDGGHPAVLFFPDGSTSGLKYSILVGATIERGILSWLGGRAVDIHVRS